MADYSTLLFRVKNHVAHIVLNRVEAANALDREMARELMEAALRCDEDRNVRAVVLGATGKAFCPGGDLKAFNSQGDNLPTYLKEVTTYLHSAVSRFTRMDPPVIAAIQGVAAGGGFSLAISADIVL